MSTSINPEKFMPNLLHLLSKAKKVAKKDEEAAVRFEDIEKQLQDMTDKHLLARVKLFDQTLLNQFLTLERCLGNIISGADTTYSDIQATKQALDVMDKNLKKIIEDSSALLERMPPPGHGPESHLHWSKPDQLGLAQKMSWEWSELGLEDRINESAAMAKIRRTYEDLETVEMKLCFQSLSIFPDGSGIKKRPLIYWWIGEGFVKSTPHMTAEEVGEEIFEKLMRKAFINKTYSDSTSSVVVKDCTMHPWIRRMLISLVSNSRLFRFDLRRTPYHDMANCRRACLAFDYPINQGDDGPKVDDLLTVFNLNILYLSLKKEWLTKLDKVEVLQLGRWQNSPTYHIELDDDEALKGLGAQKRLKYLSLRGISRITRLPSSVLGLSSLEILDLRACHNLEELPSDISSLTKLTHLDLSECYLLEGMPKGIEKLTSLQVLKGFLIESKKNTPCRLGALAKLTKLKRLSIHMGNEAVVEEKEFENLKDITSLRRLKISWGVVSHKFKQKIVEESSKFLLPADLEKLDLQGMPLADLPKWVKPNQLKKLKKLYIRGGDLGSLEHGESGEWTVEILRIKYLRNLTIGLPKLKELFPRLQHLEKFNCNEIEEGKYDPNIVF